MFLSRHACEQLTQRLPHLHRRYLVRLVAIGALSAIAANPTLEDVHAWAAAHLWMSEAPGIGAANFEARRRSKLQSVHGAHWRTGLVYQLLEPISCSYWQIVVNQGIYTDIYIYICLYICVYIYIYIWITGGLYRDGILFKCKHLAGILPACTIRTWSEAPRRLPILFACALMLLETLSQLLLLYDGIL